MLETQDGNTVTGAIQLSWYGWQSVLVDAGAFGLTWLGLSNGSGAAALVGDGVYGLAPPGIHLANGEQERAWGSLFVRVMFPLIGGAIVAGNMQPNEDDGGWVNRGLGFALGSGMGMIGVACLDDLVISWKRVPNGAAQPSNPTDDHRDDPRPSSPIPRFNGFVSWAPGGAYVGIVGTM